MGPTGRRTLLGSIIASGLALFGLRKTWAETAPDEITMPDDLMASEVPMTGIDPQIAARLQEMLKTFPYEYVTVSGSEAMATWERIRAEGKGWPVIIGDDEDLFGTIDQMTIDDPNALQPKASAARSEKIARTLAAAEKLSMPGDLRKLMGEDAEYLQTDIGEWPKDVHADNDPAVIFDTLTRKLKDKVHILIIPAAKDWEVPAYLNWGGWNACPPPEVHVAMLKSWDDKYGVELVAITPDTIELRRREVTPMSREEAIALAQTQYLYCNDIVDQGVGSVAALAATVQVSRWWFFWWD